MSCASGTDDERINSAQARRFAITQRDLRWQALAKRHPRDTLAGAVRIPYAFMNTVSDVAIF